MPIEVRVGRNWLPPKATQLAELKKWAGGAKFDGGWLHVDAAGGAPTHFESMDGKKMPLRLHDGRK